MIVTILAIVVKKSELIVWSGGSADIDMKENWKKY